MPTRKPYDHPIELAEGATLPKPAKLYPLNPQERNSLDGWIDEQDVTSRPLNASSIGQVV